MSTFLLDHALKNVWCTPEQDRQFIFKPAKVSPASGAKRYVEVMHTVVPLPNNTDIFYVYQIGSVDADLLNILVSVNTWTPVSRLCRENDLVVDLYTDSGVQFPRFASYMMVAKNNTVFVAVKHMAKIQPGLSNNPLYVRFYSNAYFNSVRNSTDGHPDSIYTYGLVVGSQNDILDVQSSFATYRALVGHVYGFINGYMVNDITIQNTVAGDVIEFVYDSTIKDIRDYAVSDLSVFHSILDSVNKFLLADFTYDSNTIQFQDDIDFWLYRDQPLNKIKGVALHKNLPSCVRMITHKDYALSADVIQSFVANSGLFSSLSDVRVRMHIRNSGYDRPLVFETNRIHELYKLDPLNRLKAMVGVDAVLPQWRAENLENNAYVKIMGNYSQFITAEQVETAYGYNAISKILADTPQRVVDDNGELSALLPVGLRTNSTVYEYAANGRLNDVITHSGGEYHVASSSVPGCSLIEVVSGRGGLHSGSIFNTNNVPLLEGVGYRFYKATKNTAPSGQVWEACVEGDDYGISNGVLTWRLPLISWDVQVRGDDRFVSYELTLPETEMLFQFSINANCTVEAELENRPVSVPYAELDLWLNRRALVYGIDYKVQWPVVTIINKEWANASGVNKVYVRCRGFCNDDFKFVDDSETGMVVANLLSQDHQVGIRDDRVLRIVVNGAVKHRDDLKFAENGMPTVSHVDNNKPYSIRSLDVGLSEFVSAENSADSGFKLFAKEIDRRISQYLTTRLPEPEITVPSIGTNKYQLYSPFLAKIFYDLVNNNLDSAIYLEDRTDNQVRTALRAYEPLLALDPCLNNKLDLDLFVIGPFPNNSTVTTTLRKRLFLERVCRLYLNNRVDLTPHITVTGV